VTRKGIWRLVGLLAVVGVAYFLLGYVVMVRFIP